MRRCLDAEDGATPISSMLGVAVFLAFLLFSIQVVLYLYTATVVQAAAVDGANVGAGAAQTSAVGAGRDHARRVLGGFADGAVVTGRLVDDAAGQQLVISITVDTPSTVAAGLGLGTISREAAVRVER